MLQTSLLISHIAILVEVTDIHYIRTHSFSNQEKQRSARGLHVCWAPDWPNQAASSHAARDRLNHCFQQATKIFTKHRLIKSTLPPHISWTPPSDSVNDSAETTSQGSAWIKHTHSNHLLDSYLLLGRDSGTAALLLLDPARVFTCRREQNLYQLLLFRGHGSN